jgi:hypothetical protein
LNRPFRSVGELGYVFRDQPFKTLDFFSKSSADAALLDVFCVTDQARVERSKLNTVVAGQVNLSNAPTPVLQAILASGSKKNMDATYNISNTAPAAAPATKTLAQNIGKELDLSSGAGPMMSRAELVTRLGTDLLTGIGVIRNSFTSSPDQGNKAYLESPVRALADVVNTRTWNLMIDVIAQTGVFPPGSTDLNKFVVQGERRYWLHIALDRLTGKVIDQQLEPVYE